MPRKPKALPPPTKTRAEIDLEIIDKQRKALSYRRMGLSYADAARRMKMGVWDYHSLVTDAVKQSLAELKETADEIREMELQRLDEIMSGIYRQAVGGDLMAVAGVLKIMERRAKLLGLDRLDELKAQEMAKVLADEMEAERGKRYIVPVPPQIELADWAKRFNPDTLSAN